jgi:hypothetical protein
MDALERVLRIGREPPSDRWAPDRFRQAAAEGKKRWHEIEKLFEVQYSMFKGCDPAGAQEFGAFERIDQSTWLRPGGREKLVFVKKASSSRMCFGKQSNLKEERQDGSVYCNGCSVGNRPFRRGENR